MLGMLRDYEELGAQSGVAVQCDKPCRTLTSRDWESQLSRMKDSIVFVDEGNAFVSSRVVIHGRAVFVLGKNLRVKTSLTHIPHNARLPLPG